MGISQTQDQRAEAGIQASITIDEVAQKWATIHTSKVEVRAFSDNLLDVLGLGTGGWEFLLPLLEQILSKCECRKRKLEPDKWSRSPCDECIQEFVKSQKEQVEELSTDCKKMIKELKQGIEYANLMTDEKIQEWATIYLAKVEDAAVYVWNCYATSCCREFAGVGDIKAGKLSNAELYATAM